jgi:hypothetical protein
MPMNKLLVAGGMLVLLGGASGCGSDSHDKLVEDMIEVINSTGDILNDIANAKDKGKAASNKAEDLKKKGEQLRELMRRANSIKEPLNAEEKERLKKEYQARLEKAIARTSALWEKVRKMDQVEKTLERKGALEFFNYARPGPG